jgi:hypothetical protein
VRWAWRRPPVSPSSLPANGGSEGWPDHPAPPIARWRVRVAENAPNTHHLPSAATGDDNGGGSGGSSGANQRPGSPPGHAGRPIGPNGVREEPLSGDVAQKVRVAALAKVDGGTIERVETDADHGSPYEAHVRRSDGTELEVLVNKDFEVTAVNEMQHP